MEAFAIRDLTFYYPGQAAPALDRLTLEVPQGAFLVLCGPSGCGKSTLLRQLKTSLAPHGRKSGSIWFEGRPLDEVGAREQSQKIGFVLQSPENQIVTDKVWHELAFGLESLGMDTPGIRRRVAEMAAFFGIEGWFGKNVAELSGGQKQLLSLASVMAMDPAVLVLDEPASQLDPVAAAEFLAALGRVNRELGVTVILSEHRLEDALAHATHAAVLDRGRVLCTGTPAEVGERLRRGGHGMFFAMPAAMRVWASAPGAAPPCPVTVRDGRAWLRGYSQANGLRPVPPEQIRAAGEEVLRADDLWFAYEQGAPEVVRGLSLGVRRGELLALLGGNGAGKTTALKLLAGLRRPLRGAVDAKGSIGLLPQDPQTLFVKSTVRADLRDAGGDISEAVRLCRLDGLLDRHPYDLSGGEQQRAALAKVLLRRPDILLLDEPTKGLDAAFKRELAAVLGDLLARGTAVVMVSHDVEFCAAYADRCALFFDGAIAAEGTPRDFFAGNSFYTTAANRMARGLARDAVTPEDLIAVCGGEQPDPPSAPRTQAVPGAAEAVPKQTPLPWWRRLLALASAAVIAVLFLRAVGITDLSAIASGQDPDGARQTLMMSAGIAAALVTLALAVGQRSEKPPGPPPVKKARLPRRTVAAAAAILLLIPLALFAGVRWLDARQYYVTALVVLALCMAPFFLVFEGRRPQARELTLIAALCAIGVAGRALLFMLPQFKPVTALTILAGVALGGETGFLVGAMTMLLSNMLFSQGPWTPWQMFAMGIIGFLAGVLFRKGLLRRSRMTLCAFGALTALVVYGGIMNPASALIWMRQWNWDIIISYYVTGLPMDLVHAASTALFLWFAAEPMLEKLDRIKTKYGLVQ